MPVTLLAVLANVVDAQELWCQWEGLGVRAKEAGMLLAAIELLSVWPVLPDSKMVVRMAEVWDLQWQVCACIYMCVCVLRLIPTRVRN